jgi:hypothetical protein
MWRPVGGNFLFFARLANGTVHSQLGTFVTESQKFSRIPETPVHGVPLYLTDETIKLHQTAESVVR